MGYRREWTSSIESDISLFYNDYDELSTLTLLAPSLVLTKPIHFFLPIATTNLTAGHTYGGEAVAVDWRACRTISNFRSPIVS